MKGRRLSEWARLKGLLYAERKALKCRAKSQKNRNESTSLILLHNYQRCFVSAHVKSPRVIVRLSLALPFPPLSVAPARFSVGKSKNNKKNTKEKAKVSWVCHSKIKQSTTRLALWADKNNKTTSSDTPKTYSAHDGWWEAEQVGRRRRRKEEKVSINFS